MSLLLRWYGTAVVFAGIFLIHFCEKVLVKVNPEGKYVVDIDKDIDVNKCTPNTRVALRNDSYVLHKILPTKVTVSSIKVRICRTYV